MEENNDKNQNLEEETKQAPEEMPHEEKVEQAPEKDTSSKVETASQKPAKNYKKPLIFTIILIVILLGCLGVAIYFIINPNAQNSSPSNTPQSSEEQSQGNASNGTNNQETLPETEITDTYVLNDLNTKLSYLNGVYYKNDTTTPLGLDDNIISSSYGSNVGMKLYSNNGFSTNDKILQFMDAIDYHEGRFTNYYQAEFERDLFVKLFGQNIVDLIDENMAQTSHNGWSEIYYIDGEYLRSRYNNLYGEPLPNGNLEVACRTYAYDQTNDRYFTQKVIGGCGGAGPNHIEVYKEKFTEQGDKAYIYVAVGEYNGPTNCTLFKDGTKISYENDNFTAILDPTNVYGSYPNDCYNPHINASNASEFAQYRFVFAKNSDGTYHFEKVERV